VGDTVRHSGRHTVRETQWEPQPYQRVAVQVAGAAALLERDARADQLPVALQLDAHPRRGRPRLRLVLRDA
jgi:hypothetical protein